MITRDFGSLNIIPIFHGDPADTSVIVEKKKMLRVYQCARNRPKSLGKINLDDLETSIIIGSI